MRKNTLKQKLNQDRPTLGPFVGTPSPAQVELMGWMGFDFVVIDCEHGPMDYETAEHMIRAAEASDITPILRIGMNSQQHIQRYMDAGAAGVMIPLVNNAAQGKAVVDAVKYPPVGQRGLFGGRGARLGVQPVAEYVKEANEETWVCLQIETLEAIENQDEIIATENADCIFMGPGDLSIQFGAPGQIQHPKVVETIESLTPRIRAAGKQAGTMALSPEEVGRWHDVGINWLVSSATRYLIAGARSYLDASKKQLER
ncbi:MAG: aldolase/citrate lyase family protein [Dehalococcoidia bacterium]